ncbi:MAG: hypothetical protein NTY03_00800, partial [Candidatus Bathyarchaeota archaeon]|nr:hypothetical protein [Candidatus Bathyarchaeota archaeon]
PFCTKLVKPSAVEGHEDNQSLNHFDVPGIPSVYTEIPKLSIRVNSDFTMFLPWNKKKWYIYNINEIENPYIFFKRKLYRIYDVATWPRWAHAFRSYLTKAGI